MRNYTLLNEDWKFIKEDVGVEKALSTQGSKIQIPHTWNAIDGQDGGNDYYRGKCWYVKELDLANVSEDEEVWLEFQGVAMSTEVYLNGILVGTHKGGYSTFRVNITATLAKTNILAIAVNNSKFDDIYPQKADFTFYGGIYRDVNLIIVPKSHFALGYYGTSGIKVKSDIVGVDAHVSIEAFFENVADGCEVIFSINEANAISSYKEVTAIVKNGKASVIIEIEEVHLWAGIEDPYLYAAIAKIDGDSVSTKFGCRSIAFDKDGFILNGNRYPLCGAARHQDRYGVGNAIDKAMQDEDMDIIKEMGANTIRLAHYQHSQYFYDLCDENGMIVWAEIPYITGHMENGDENTISQMKELVGQNYNHPSIVCWGLSNEITASGISEGDGIVENHEILNDICHKMDDTRPTTMAHVFMLEPEHSIVLLPDICSYNLYYGWYIGTVEDNDIWFDEFRKLYPNATIGLSEYGADANPCYQNSNPQKGDYSETYQAFYHEHMLKMWKERPYIWAMHVWNMFDFGADGRNEGGKPGQNQKGLVTFDRKLKKDAFYIYKAYLSKEPFIHICGRRYIDRAEECTEIKVYSNQEQVTLYVDGEEMSSLQGDKVFVFKINIQGEHVIEARSGTLTDSIKIKKVNEPNKDYIKEVEAVINWFDREDMQIKEGYYSIKDSIVSLKESPEAAILLAKIQEKASEAHGEVARNIKLPESMVRQMEAQPLEAVLSSAAKVITPDMAAEWNKQLNKIKKPT